MVIGILGFPKTLQEKRRKKGSMHPMHPVYAKTKDIPVNPQPKALNLNPKP